MGMDVHSRTEGNDAYFQRSVWSWRPLAECITALEPELSKADTVDWWTNSGDGLDAQGAAALAEALRNDLSLGKVEEYVKVRNDLLGRLPRERCGLCDGTGLRTDQVGVMYHYDTRRITSRANWEGGCNGCNGTGTTEPWARSYSLEESDVQDFVDFLQAAGGFAIW